MEQQPNNGSDEQVQGPFPMPSPAPNILRMRQPFKILTDIWGVMTPFSFRRDLFRYRDQHLKEYLVANFEKAEVSSWLELLVKRTAEDKEKHPEMPDLLLPLKTTDTATPTTVDRENMFDSVMANIRFRETHGLMSGLNYLFNQVWNEGYKNRTLQPTLFPDVVDCFRKWAGPPLQIKIYTFASGPWEIQKLFLSATEAGTQLTQSITCGFDAFHQFKYQAMRYRQVVATLSEREAKNLFYLTDSPNKAAEARKAGLTVFVVRREGNRKYSKEKLERFTCIDTLHQFDFYEFQ